MAVSSSTSPACRSRKMRSSSPAGNDRDAHKRCAALKTAISRASLPISDLLGEPASGPLHAARSAANEGSSAAMGEDASASAGTAASAHAATSPTNSVETRALAAASPSIQDASAALESADTSVCSASFKRSGCNDAAAGSVPMPYFSSMASSVTPSSLSMSPMNAARSTPESASTRSARGAPQASATAARILHSTGAAPPSSRRYPVSPSGPASCAAAAISLNATEPSATTPASTVARCVSAFGRSHLWSSRSSSTSLTPATRPASGAGPPALRGSSRNRDAAASQSMVRRSNPDTTRCCTNSGTRGSKPPQREMAAIASSASLSSKKYSRTRLRSVSYSSSDMGGAAAGTAEAGSGAFSFASFSRSRFALTRSRSLPTAFALRLRFARAALRSSLVNSASALTSPAALPRAPPAPSPPANTSSGAFRDASDTMSGATSSTCSAGASVLICISSTMGFGAKWKLESASSFVASAANSARASTTMGSSFSSSSLAPVFARCFCAT
mmetsp:Transcript_12607/g.52842  ORF Transcript_12607/g.52842 Transcript_12607/m.52842 type:complete len:505 (+) Transcript_12607:320-1834(+)